MSSAGMSQPPTFVPTMGVGEGVGVLVGVGVGLGVRVGTCFGVGFGIVVGVGTGVGTSVGSGVIEGTVVGDSVGDISTVVGVGDNSWNGLGVDVTSTTMVHEMRKNAATNVRIIRGFSCLKIVPNSYHSGCFNYVLPDQRVSTAIWSNDIQ